MSRRFGVAVLLSLAFFFSFVSAAAQAGDAVPTLSPPGSSPTQAPDQALFHSLHWRSLESHFPDFSPGWQRRYQELRSITEDSNAIVSQLPPLLAELKRKFLQAQKNVVYLLLDLAPITMEAIDNYYLICRLEEWEWYLADPLRYVGMVEQALATYAGVLREVGDALARPRTADTPANAALLAALPELRQMHALLTARVARLEADITPWLRPARAMTAQIRTALESTRQVQPQLWVNYYTQPLRVSWLGWERKWVDLHDIVKTLLRGELFPRPSVLGGVVALFILGSCLLFFRILEKQSGMARASGTMPGNPQDAPPKGAPGGLPRSTPMKAPGSVPDALPGGGAERSLWQVLCAVLYAQSLHRKCALTVGAVSIANLFLDAMPSVHVHIPFLTAQACLLLLSVAVWARNAKTDPPLVLLLTPVVVGYLLLEGDAAPLWMLGGMVVSQLGCVIVLSVRRERSTFAHMWLGLLMLGLLFSVLGFARMVGLALGIGLFCRAAFVVLQTLYYAKGLHDQPLRLCLVMPLMVAWLYSLGLGLGLGYTGVDAMWDYAQAEALQFFGIQVQLRELFVLLALGLSLLAFGGLSQQMLHRVSRQRNVLDSSAVPVIHAVVNSLLWVLFLLLSLGVLGVDMRSLAFIGGALTVGVGLGLQSIISNFFSGLVIIFARVVRGGDVIEVGAVRGRVHSVNMRATVVETVEGAILLVPNMEMLNSRLTNWTRNNRHVREDVKIRLAQKNDIQAAMRLMEKVAARQDGILSDPAPTALLLKSDEGVADIALQVWVEDVDSKRACLSSLHNELFRTLSREGVSLAGPALDVVVTQGC